MAGRVLIGTSSWTDPTLVKEGNFYPPGTTTAEARLKFYASRFPLVEVDSTYYYPPSEKNSVLWIERTPADFTFNIKAYSLLTNHPTKVDSLYNDIKAALPAEAVEKRNVYRDKLPDEAVDEIWQRFRDALMPLHSAGKLGAVLFQFPQWFVIGRKSKAYIEVRLRRYTAGVRLQRAADRGRHRRRSCDGAVPRSGPGGVECEERERFGPLPLRLHAGGTGGMGSQDPRARLGDPRDPRPDEQLLPRLRRQERQRARRPPTRIASQRGVWAAWS
jgi:Protein of unknown function DUF72